VVAAPASVKPDTTPRELPTRVSDCKIIETRRVTESLAVSINAKNQRRSKRKCKTTFYTKNPSYTNNSNKSNNSDNTILIS
jgi:hypothetical protein